MWIPVALYSACTQVSGHWPSEGGPHGEYNWRRESLRRHGCQARGSATSWGPRGGCRFSDLYFEPVLRRICDTAVVRLQGVWPRIEQSKLMQTCNHGLRRSMCVYQLHPCFGGAAVLIYFVLIWHWYAVRPYITANWFWCLAGNRGYSTFAGVFDPGNGRIGPAIFKISPAILREAPNAVYRFSRTAVWKIVDTPQFPLW